METIGGVDEAGRGPVFGPMVIAGVTFSKSEVDLLVELGVKDSKLLTPARRSLLSNQIHRLAEEIKVVKVSPSEIDKFVKRGIKFRKLNFLEAMKMGFIINHLSADEVYVDAPDTDLNRFSGILQQFVTRKVKIVCRHKEDRRNPVVAAASIVAKVRRDLEIEKLRNVYGDFGSGYPSDKATFEFLSNWVLEKSKPPPFTRTSWKTLRRIGPKITDY